jgi:molybdopterin synthase catalytic subunit/molybdopterin converting factor small subunit
MPADASPPHTGVSLRTLIVMLVRVRLFAQLRERAGRSAIELELPEGARVADALAAVGDLADGIPLVMAVNREYASADDVLHAADELALVPPVSGGSGALEPSALHWAIVDHALSLDALAARVRDPRAGAVVTFSGTTRDVDFLDYEAYAEMALAELERIVRAAAARHGLTAAAAEHRIGRVALGEASVIVAASAPHRPEAFLGARELIDEIKAQLPIWKREEGEFVPGSMPRHRADPSA